MLMDKHRSIIVFTLRQPLGRLNGYHPSIGYVCFSYHVHRINRGPLLFPLWGTQSIAGLKRNGYHPMMDLFVSTTLMFLLAWYPLIYLWYKTTKTIPDDHVFLNFPIISTSISYIIIYPLNTMSNYGFCRTQGTEICTLP